MPDVTDLKSFIQWARPDGGLLNICSMVPDGKLTGRTFLLPDEIDACSDFIQSENKHSNIYWTVNQVDRKINTKPSKRAITAVLFAHVDIDPICENPDSYEAARAFIFSNLASYQERYHPNIVIDSGNGIQMFWRHKDPLTIEMGEAINKQLIEVLGGDKGTWGADRLMRVPFTINYTTAAKLAKGYPIEPALAEVI